MTSCGPREIVERLGPHPTALLAIDLATEEGVGQWWIAVCLLSTRVDEGRALEAFRSLASAGLGSPAAIAGPATSGPVENSKLEVVVNPLLTRRLPPAATARKGLEPDHGWRYYALGEIISTRPLRADLGLLCLELDREEVDAWAIGDRVSLAIDRIILTRESG